MRTAATISILVLLLGAPVARGDEEAARYFVGRGDRALEAGEPGEAETHYQKALAEKPDFPPALFGLARVAEAREDDDLAAARLEACIDACERISGSDDVREQAEALLAKLDRARLEYRRIVDEYVAALLDLAHRSLDDAPDLARRCLERIRKVCPEHEEARDLLAKLGPAPDSAAAVAGADTGEGVALFNGKDLDGWAADPPTWTVRDGLLVGTASDGAYYGRTRRTAKGDFTFACEMRVATDLGDKPMVALVFGMREVYDRWDMVVWNSKFRLSRYEDGVKEVQKLDEVPFYQLAGEFDRTAWNTYEVVVEGDVATVRVNGRRILERTATPGDFDGFLGFVVQDCTTEIRNVRLVE